MLAQESEEPDKPAAITLIERRTKRVPDCPVCGSDGFETIVNARDYITSTPGKWIFRECRQCRSLWQDPCTIEEDIPGLYPENYDFTRIDLDPVAASEIGFATNLKFAILERRYGYKTNLSGPGSAIISLAGSVLSILPGLRSRAGQTVRFLHQKPGGRLLDVGCGNGGFLRFMKRLGWEIHGIEPDPHAAAVAAKHGIPVSIGTVENTELPEAYYDAVTMSHVLEHFPDPQRAIDRIARTLKPGGVFVSLSPNPSGALSKLFRDHWYGLDAPRHLVIPSARGCAILCERAGLRPHCRTTMHIAPYNFDESLSLRRTGTTGQYSSILFFRLFSLVGSLSHAFFPWIGEEIVCVAKR